VLLQNRAENYLTPQKWISILPRHFNPHSSSPHSNSPTAHELPTAPSRHPIMTRLEIACFNATSVSHKSHSSSSHSHSFFKKRQSLKHVTSHPLILTTTLNSSPWLQLPQPFQTPTRLPTIPPTQIHNPLTNPTCRLSTAPATAPPASNFAPTNPSAASPPLSQHTSRSGTTPL
jgi:hypothetical protein